MVSTSISISSSWKSVLLFILMSLGIITAGVLFYSQQKIYISEDKHRDLKNLNTMKAEEIVHWWQESRMDIQFIASTLVEPEEIDRMRGGALMSTLLISFQERTTAAAHSRGYKRIGLLAQNGRVLVSLPDTIDVPPPFLRQALAADTIVCSNLYLAAGGRPALQLAAPVYGFNQGQRVRFGTLFLEIDPEPGIYTSLRSLYVNEPTSEALIARREGDGIVYLSPLRYSNTPPLSVLASINSNIVAAQVMRGISVIEGVDYRQHAVFAHAEPIGVLDWYLVVKMDEQDVFQPLKKIAWLSGIITLSLIFAAGAGIALYGRQQAAQSYRRQLEDAMDRKALARHYEHLTKYAYDIIVLFDTKGTVVEMNEAALAAFGRTREEFAFLTLEHLCVPELKNTVEEKIRSLGPDEGVVLEGWFRRKSGETFCGEMGMRVIDIEGAYYLQAIIRDVTDRRHAEEVIRENEARLRVLIANFPGIISLVDAEGIIKIAEGRGLKDLGIVPGTSIGESIFTVYASMPSVTSAIRAAMNGEESRSIQDMKGLSFETHFLPYRDEAGTVRGVLSLSTNITERLQAEDRLRRTEVRLHSLFNNMNEGVALHRLLYDEHGVPNNYEVYEVNGQYESILGVSRDTVLNKPATEAYGVDIPPYLKEYSDVAETGKSFHFETYFPPRDKYFYISVASLGKGQFATIFIDISDAKHAETKILALNSELVEKNKELEQIIYITSHDLRSPLVNIEGFSKEINRELRSYADAVQAENDPEKIRRLLAAFEKEVSSSFGYISASTIKMDQLLAGLLKISRLGRLVIAPKQVEMGLLMEKILDTMQYRLEEKGVLVSVAPLPNCSGEETLLNQVFSNLLDNALKYLSPDRPGVITVDGEDNGIEVVYRVTDNGRGIAPEFHQQVFEIFRRLDVSTPGEGLGLSICSKILQRLNGKIRLTSVPGQGSTFHVSLPSL